MICKKMNNQLEHDKIIYDVSLLLGVPLPVKPIDNRNILTKLNKSVRKCSAKRCNFNATHANSLLNNNPFCWYHSLEMSQSETGYGQEPVKEEELTFNT